jgi:hypothetical protein
VAVRDAYFARLMAFRGRRSVLAIGLLESVGRSHSLFGPTLTTEQEDQGV